MLTENDLRPAPDPVHSFQWMGSHDKRRSSDVTDSFLQVSAAAHRLVGHLRNIPSPHRVVAATGAVETARWDHRMTEQRRLSPVVILRTYVLPGQARGADGEPPVGHHGVSTTLRHAHFRTSAMLAEPLDRGISRKHMNAHQGTIEGQSCQFSAPPPRGERARSTRVHVGWDLGPVPKAVDPQGAWLESSHLNVEDPRMMIRAALGSRGQTRSLRPKVGFFGLLGSGNLGNDGSFEAVLTHLRVHHPEAVVDAMCMGSERMSSQYGVPAIPLHWSTGSADRVERVERQVVWLLGKGADAWRTFSWVRRHDLVVVAGAGVLENSLPMRATGVPYAMFLLCASGRLSRTKVALLSVGATRIKQRPTRWLRNSAAQLAYYRSYRDSVSWEVMQEAGALQLMTPCTLTSSSRSRHPRRRSAILDWWAWVSWRSSEAPTIGATDPRFISAISTR